MFILPIIIIVLSGLQTAFAPVLRPQFLVGFDSEPRYEVGSADSPWCIEWLGQNCNQLGLPNSDWVSGSF